MEFVTFELSKKLKDLGFNEPFFFFYREDDKDKYVHHASISKPLIYCNKIDNEVIIAPTIAQVLRWLREEKNIHIEIRLFTYGYGFDIYKIYPKERMVWSGTLEYETFEQATLKGIEYVLDNLF